MKVAVVLNGVLSPEKTCATVLVFDYGEKDPRNFSIMRFDDCEVRGKSFSGIIHYTPEGLGHLRGSWLFENKRCDKSKREYYYREELNVEEGI